MVKRISISVFAAIIIVTGIIAMRKVSFINRSARIFNVSLLEQQPGVGRDRGGFEGRGGFPEGRDFRKGNHQRELPDSVRSGLERNMPPAGIRERNIPDSLRRQFESRERFGERPGAEGAMRGGRDFGRGRPGGGAKINLGSVAWYLAVFALFTLIAVYSDKALSLVKKKKNC
jgi:hypothetical protein